MKINRKLIARIVVILLLAIICAAGWYYLVRPHGSVSAAWDSLVNPVPVVPDGILNASGTVETTALSIAPELSGKVLEVNFQEGDTVKAGDLLVQLDDSTLKIQRTIAAASLETAKLSLQKLSSPMVIANLQQTIAKDKQAIDDAQQVLDTQKYFIYNTDAVQSAQAKLYLARAALDKAQEAYDKIKYNNNLDSNVKAQAYQNVYRYILAYDNALAAVNMWTGVPNQEQVDLKTAALALANARLAEDQAYLEALNGASISANASGAGIMNLQQTRIAAQVAQANLDMLDHKIEKMGITAPVDGVVMTRSVEPGNVVNPGIELLSLARINQLTITVYIPVDSYAKIKMGQTASVSFDSFPGQAFHAAVVNISKQPQFIPRTTKTVSGGQSTVYAIQLELGNLTGKIKPGMPADVTFSLK